MATTITITSPRLTGAIVNNRVVLSQPDPTDVVTRTITADDKTALAFAQRMANLANWTPDNPDCALPGLMATVNYWMAEARLEAQTVADIAHASDLTTTAQSVFGSGVIEVQ